MPRSSVEDIELALDAAHKAKEQWNRSSPTTRSNILLKIADRLEQNLELLAVAETWDNGKPIRETLAADIPLAIDHFRYFAGCIRAQEGGISKSTKILLLIIFMSRWVWWARLSRGISRF